MTWYYVPSSKWNGKCARCGAKRRIITISSLENFLLLTSAHTQRSGGAYITIET